MQCRGPAMACDLHQLSIDLKHNLAAFANFEGRTTVEHKNMNEGTRTRCTTLFLKFGSQERCDHNSERIRQVNETLAIVLDHVDDASH